VKFLLRNKEDGFKWVLVLVRILLGVNLDVLDIGGLMRGRGL
jgi:hypothetical protein